jgi:23S rRNA (cytidine1920-2'-O)/16S rRNA (cytidine1409-2'-O)-methyltransferase
VAKEKIRLDHLLVDKGLAENRTRAQALIMAGLVFSGDKKLDKAGTKVSIETELRVKGKDHPWVSRGGLKLEKGLKESELDITGMICMDVGASTGGFSDVMLTNGASKVYAVDVGYGQLAHKIRNHENVVVLERMNARNLTDEHIKDEIDLIVCDASFISLKKVLETPLKFVKNKAYLIALIKPQFEVGKGKVGKGGVVRDTSLHIKVCEEIHTWLSEKDGWQVKSIVQSPIKGPEGNVEFLIIGEYNRP